MALIVETGAVVTGANTYQDVAAAKVAALAWGVSFGAASDSAISAALLAGAMKVNTFPQLYNGVALGRMAFPRRGLVDRQGREIAEDEVPDGVVLAQLLYAAQQLRQSFLGAAAADPGIKRIKAEVEVEYFEGRAVFEVVPSANDLLDQYTAASGDWIMQEGRVPLPVYGGDYWP